MKAYTDLEQSKRLAEFLPIESADCYWDYDEMQKFHRISWFEDGYNKESQLMLNENNVCAWSLTALLGVLPQSITKYIEGQCCQKTFHLNLFRSYYYCVSYDEVPSVNDDNSLYCVGRDNWVDACVAMIEKLHELKML